MTAPGGRGGGRETDRLAGRSRTPSHSVAPLARIVLDKI